MLIAFSSGIVGALVVFWANGASTNPVVGWFGEFLRSPGFTGLCAVIAAGIAIVGISLQLSASRQRDADAAWWQSFEWASDRGLPRDSSELKLPSDAAIDTLNALATAARTDIQKHAVGGVVDELLRARTVDVVGSAPNAHQHTQTPTPGSSAEAGGEVHSHGEAEVSQHSGAQADELVADPRVGKPDVDASGSDPSDSDDVANDDADVSDRFASLWRYAMEHMGTAAESRRAAKSGYEDEVLRALRHQYEHVTRTTGSQAGDFVVEVRGRTLVGAIQWAPGLTRHSLQPERLHGVDLVISNARAEFVPPPLEQVVWDPRQGSSSLRKALDAID